MPDVSQVLIDRELIERAIERLEIEENRRGIGTTLPAELRAALRKAAPEAQPAYVPMTLADVYKLDDSIDPELWDRAHGHVIRKIEAEVLRRMGVRP